MKANRMFKSFLACLLTFSVFAVNSSGLYANEAMPEITDKVALETGGDQAVNEAVSEIIEEVALGEEETSENIPAEKAANETALKSEEVPKDAPKSDETVPEITDKAILETRVSDKKSSIQPRLPANYDQVCMGGGYNDKPSDTGNHNNTGKPNQNARTEREFWDVTAENVFGTYVSEEELILREWTYKKGNKENGYFKPAVLTPDYDCYFANAPNGYGEEVGGLYYKYDAAWAASVGWDAKSPPRAQADQPNNVNFVGNYVYQDGGRYRYPFTIVTRPTLTFQDKTNYYAGKAGEPRRRLPRVYVKAGSIYYTADPLMTKYYFDGNGSISVENDYPTSVGTYEVTAQTPINIPQFILPGRAKKTLNFLKKGYVTKFQMKVDDRTPVEMTDLDWNAGARPSEPDSDMMTKFGIKMYLEEKTYTIPVPQYDQSKYIFEGWEVTEQVVNSWDQEVPAVETRTLSEINGLYQYTPKKIGEHATFILDATFTAKLRTRKTDEITARTQIINGGSFYSDVSASPDSITLTEGIDSDKSFTAQIKNSRLAYDFIGWSDDPNNPTKLGTSMTYKPPNNTATQAEQVKRSTLYATFSPKPYKITFHGNGGKVLNVIEETFQDTYYYSTVKLQANQFIKEGYWFKGWSTNKESRTPEYSDGQNFQVPNPIGGVNPPEGITLYAVWGRDTANVTIDQDLVKDTLFMEHGGWSAVADNVRAANQDEPWQAYEIARFYFDVELMNPVNSQEELNKDKFYVIWQRSRDGGKTFQNVPGNHNSTSPFITVPIGNVDKGFARVQYDEERGKWFAPLMVRGNAGSSADLIEGIYRVNVAYEDVQATERVATHEEFLAGNTKGWTIGTANIEVKVVSTFDTVVSVPADVTLTDKTEIVGGFAKEVVESVHRSNKVTVNKVEHQLTNKEDYDWSTPNTAFDGIAEGTPERDYPNGGHKEYMKQKPFRVSINFDGTLTDTSDAKNKISGIGMYYSPEHTDPTKRNQPLKTGTLSSFEYDGLETNKTLFDFYLKGDKPDGLPVGITFKGNITFKIENVKILMP